MYRWEVVSLGKGFSTTAMARALKSQSMRAWAFINVYLEGQGDLVSRSIMALARVGLQGL